MRLTRVRPSAMSSTNGFGTPVLIESISSVVSFLPVARVGVPVRGDHPLVDALGALDLDVLFDCEQCDEALVLSVGEQVRASVQGAPCPVQRIGGATTVPVQFLLHAPAAPVEDVTGEADDVEWVHHRGRVRDLLRRCGFEPGEPIHRDDLHTVTPVGGPVGKPGLEDLLGPSGNHVQQPCPTSVLDRSRPGSV